MLRLKRNSPSGRRLVLVTASLEAGGSERQLADMASYWAVIGLDVTLASWSGPDVADFYRLNPGVRRIYLDADSSAAIFGTVSATLRRIRKLRSLISTHRPDAVLSFIAESNILTILATAGMRSRIVISERAHPALDTNVPWVWRVLRRVLYGWSDEVVAQTRETSQWIERNCRTKVRVIPNALRSLPPASTQGREPLIVAIGRLTHQKGFDLLLRAFARIAGRFPEWRVAVLGEGGDRASLQRLRDELLLTDRVDFLGRVGNVEPWLARAELVVQPSRFEGFPNAVLEAMGMGAAVISADCLAGPAELIKDGVNGRLTPVEDIPALAEVMSELMSQPQLRARLGREALKVRDRFRPDLVMSQWNECLLLQPSPGAVGTKDVLQ